MLMIEDLSKIMAILYPNLRMHIDIHDNGYRIAIDNERENNPPQYYRERKELVKMLSKLNDLYIIKICDGTYYVIKLMYIKYVYCNPLQEDAVIKSTDDIYIPNIYDIDIETMTKLGIKVFEKDD